MAPNKFLTDADFYPTNKNGNVLTDSDFSDQSQNSNIAVADIQHPSVDIPAPSNEDQGQSSQPFGYKEAAMVGPMARGVEAVQKGLNPIQDAPYVVAKVISGALGGIPELLSKYPMAGPMQISSPGQSVMPQPATDEGRKLGGEMGMAAGFFPAVEALQEIIAPAAQTAAKATSNRLMNSVLKPTIRDLQQNPELGFQAAKSGLTGTKQQIFDKAEKMISANEDKLQKILDNSQGMVDASKVADVIDEIKKPFANTGDKNAVAAIEELQNNLRTKGSMTLKEANQLKRDFYTTLKETNYGTAEVGPKVAAKKAAARGLREGIEKAEPNQPIGQINKNLALAGKTRNLAEKAGNAAQRSGLTGLIDTGLIGGGIGTGNPAFYLGLLARKTAGSDLFKTKLAELLSKMV